jgi:hypothetical protein
VNGFLLLVGDHKQLAPISKSTKDLTFSHWSYPVTGVIGCLDTLEPTTASKDEFDAASAASASATSKATIDFLHLRLNETTARAALLYICCVSRTDNLASELKHFHNQKFQLIPQERASSDDLRRLNAQIVYLFQLNCPAAQFLLDQGADLIKRALTVKGLGFARAVSEWEQSIERLHFTQVSRHICCVRYKQLTVPFRTSESQLKAFLT